MGLGRAGRCPECLSDRLVVEDLDGAGEYELADTVKGTRAGYEDRQIICEPETTRGQPAPADD